MKALALMPFDKSFKSVYRFMKKACDNYGNGESSGSNGSSAELRTPIAFDRLDDRPGPSFHIVDELLDSLRNCDFCIADLTGNNQNVLWEVGFAMALEKPMILIADKDSEEPVFDVRQMKVTKYDRENLDTTLEEVLAVEIKHLVQNITDVPALGLHAKALAMSISSPTYFLDSSYTIHYMNEAAADLFSLDRGRKSWIGNNLREFINAIAVNLDNLPAIEKNLQTQLEEIKQLEAERRPFAIPAYNIEPIELRSSRYGKLKLQKTGVAVRDASSGKILGWVVSFNVVKAYEPEKYASFHVKHRFQIEALMGHPEYTKKSSEADDAPPEEQLVVWGDDRRTQDWVRDGCNSPALFRAETYAEKQSLFDFCVSVMTTDAERYGLESVQYLDEWFFDYHKAVYLIMKTPDGDMVGVCRIHMNRQCDFPEYAGLEEWVNEKVKNGESFADVGIYLHPEISESKTRTACVAKMVGRAAYEAQRHGQTYIYAQVPTYLGSTFYGFLFERAGINFDCPGWKQPGWTPIAVPCQRYGNSASNPDDEIRENTDLEFVGEARRTFEHAQGGQSIV